MTIYHKHRILPGHMGGTYEPSNVIKLNIKDHAAWHYELWCYYGKYEDYCAWILLSNQKNTPEEIQIEYCRLGGAWHKGKIKKLNHCEKIGIANKGNINGKGNKGKTRKLKPSKRNNLPDINKPIKSQYKGNRSDTLSLEYQGISIDGKIIRFRNMAEFCRNNNISPGNAWAVLQGKQTHTKGWKFTYC